jgi:hypothetical protein
MHLTCTNIDAEKVRAALRTAKDAGIRNIVALRGDAPGELEGGETKKWVATEGGFNCGEVKRGRTHTCDASKMKTHYWTFVSFVVGGDFSRGIV